MDGINNKAKMPKDFPQPLTCFYWHTYGVCTKSNDECLYAHYPTDVVAAAPVSFSNSRGPVAGQNAIYKLDSQFRREQHLQEWESRLQAKEMQLNGKSIEGIHCTSLRQVIATGKVSACKVREALLHIEQLAKSNDAEFVEESIAQATEAVGNLETDLEDLLQLLDERQSNR